MLPVLNIQAVFRWSLTKYVLRRRGLIGCTVQRIAGPTLDAMDEKDVDAFLDDLDDLLPPQSALKEVIRKRHQCMARLELRNVSKSFGDTTVIPGLDLIVENGEFCVFVGPSGCGKSTLLRMIAGLEECTGGDVLMNGEDVTDQQPARRGIAMVFQSYALYPHMTVAENLGFGLKIAKVDTRAIEAKVAAAAKILQIEHLMKRRPKDLSGGQRQRCHRPRHRARAAPCSCLTSPCPTWMQPCGSKCASSWPRSSRS